MKVTKYEQLTLDKCPRLKTYGSYKIVDDENRKPFCKCNNQRGDWVTGCLSCNKRIRA